MLYASKGIERQVLLTTESFALLPRFFARQPHGGAGSRAARAASARPEAGTPPLPVPDVVESMYWSPSVAQEPGHMWLRDLMRSIAHAL